MASIQKEIETKARPDDVWAAIADIGALHTRLVPGFVVDTKLEPGARVVKFDNGMVVREPIVTIEVTSRRLVWTAEGGRTTHYNASVQVFSQARRNYRRRLDRRFSAGRHDGSNCRGDGNRHDRDEKNARSAGAVEFFARASYRSCENMAGRATRESRVEIPVDPCEALCSQPPL